jgi:hypothetical protein
MIAPVSGQSTWAGKGGAAVDALHRKACGPVHCHIPAHIVHLEHFLLCLDHEAVVHSHLAKLQAQCTMMVNASYAFQSRQVTVGWGMRHHLVLDDGYLLAMVASQDVVDEGSLAAPLQGCKGMSGNEPAYGGNVQRLRRHPQCLPRCLPETL